MGISKTTGSLRCCPFHSVIEYGRDYKYVLLLPHLFVSGDYNIAGRILLLPINGEGKFRGNFSEWCDALVDCFLFVFFGG